jgi:hypothetical protein
MKYLILIPVLIMLAGCATTMDMKRDKVLTCVKDLADNGATMDEAFNICHHVYRLRKLND